MPRGVRIEYPGARYHVISRGNRREFILGESDDKEMFLETLAEGCQRSGWLVHSYVLMDNHFHLLLETPEANLSEGMRWIQGTYGTRYNRRHGLVGHVWQGRFKSPVISDEGDEHFLTVSNYIHLNPARAGLLPKTNSRLSDYPWSSFPALGGVPSKGPEWLKAARLFRAYELKSDDAASRRKFRERVEWLCAECMAGGLDEDAEQERKNFLRGWYIGNKSFKTRLEDHIERAVTGRKKDSLSGKAKNLHDEMQAKKLIERSRIHWGRAREELLKLKPGDQRKTMLVLLLRERTMVTYDWIIEEIGMGSKSSMQNAISRGRGFSGPQLKEWKRFQKVII